MRCFNYRSIIGLLPPRNALLDLVGTSHSGVRTSFLAQSSSIDCRNYDTFFLTTQPTNQQTRQHQKCPPPLRETTTKGADRAQFAYEHAFILFTQHPSYGAYGIGYTRSQSQVKGFQFSKYIFLMGFVSFRSLWSSQIFALAKQRLMITKLWIRG